MGSKSENKNFPLWCFHCKSEITAIMNGWQLCSGDLALLCVTCGSAYEDGSFCPRFHRKETGWSDCAYCGKMLHSGCVMSLKDIILMDYGGFCCLDCGKKHPIGVRIKQMNIVFSS
ncbi:PREDICTED: B3 domain-containing transcription repressor VAL1-like [Lupinus angustifolius]|uniref:B3 domain-containing transcription repressor VAL1-like n=1 Tax=Lupinus angustifolius TaxID=3871 RepID=UPI00092EBE51|nr:PREDICTED: B3 domain-containing transcription repressor VAL1-like [Lupinus angustifolius]